MSKAENWPTKSTLRFYARKTKLLFQVRGLKFDLSDDLMLWWPKAHRTVYLGLSTTNRNWTNWTETNLAKIERHIRYDLGFDGYSVRINRLTLGHPKCSKEFLWQLQISTK